jgi:hypothetical protein
MLLALLTSAACLAQPASFVTNGRFNGTRGWNLVPTHSIVQRAPGDTCLLATSSASSQTIWRRADWQKMSAAVDIRVEDFQQENPPGFAYAAIYQYDDAMKITAFTDFIQLRAPTDWKRYTYTFDLAPATTMIYFNLGFFQAHGRAYFDNATLVLGEKPATMDEVTEWVPAAGVGASVLVWAEDDLPVPAGGADPKWIVSTLRKSGLKAEAATADAMPRSLRPSVFGTLVLPYGAAYPYERRSDIIDFCRSGGRLIVLGGYPMNSPLARVNGKWIDWRDEAARRRADAIKWPNNLLPDGGFEKTADPPLGDTALDGAWHRDNPKALIVADNPAEGGKCGFVEVSPDETFGHGAERKLYCWLPAQAGHEYRFSASIKTAGIVGEGFAYLAVYQYRGDQLATPRDVLQLRGANDWRSADYQFTTDPGVDRIYIKVGIYQAKGRAWFDKVQLVALTGLGYSPLNTATGSPGDGLGIAAYQMGMCDADYRLRRVASLSPAAGQQIVRAPKLTGPLTGWATSGVIAAGSRWVPLLNTYDRFGRLRGAAGAMLLNFAGFYAGSQWAYFGVEDRPLFGPSVAGSDADLVRLVKWLQRGCFMSNLRPEFFAYDPGEIANVKLRVHDFGSGALRATVELAAFSADRQVASAKTSLDVLAGSSSDASLKLSLPANLRGLVKIRARLLEDGALIDEDETGTLVRDPAAVARGPRLDFRDNYFRLNGRPLFLYGSDNYASDYTSSVMNPARWNDIQRAARDHGLQVYENLQYSGPGHKYSDADWRGFDAMAQLLQDRGLVFMCGLLIGHNVACDDAELAAEGQQCADYAARMGNVPSMLWYINGDFQLRYEDTKWLASAWNQWLKDRYGTDAALAAAWRMDKLPAPLGSLPFPPQGPGGWADPVQVDRITFNVWLMRRWIERHVSEIRKHDSNHPITSEYYMEPFDGIDLRQTIGAHDVANIGFFSTPHTDLEVLPQSLAMNDLRYLGKGVNLGEYGVKTHPAWSLDNGASGYHIQRTEVEERQLFMAVAAYGLGMGASKVQNWCLRDGDDWVFPWGIFYPGPDVPKDVAYTHRNLSMMWRMIEPRYQAPDLTILAPTPLRNGNEGWLGNAPVFMAAQGLLRLHLPFNVADDFNLDKLPAATRTVVWPAAVAASERSFTQITDWVKRGGQLILSGFPGWDENRRQAQADRLAALLGATSAERLFTGVTYNDGPPLAARLGGGSVLLRPQARIKPAADAKVLLAADDGTPLLVARKLGDGTVVWLADPVELRRDAVPALVDLYRLAFAALPKAPAPLGVTPDDSRLHVMRQRTATGFAWILYPVADDAPRLATIATPAGPVQVGLRPWWPAMVQISDDGRVLMALCDGALKVGDQQVVAGGPMIGLASLDGQDVRKTKALLLCPFEQGETILRGLPGAGEWGDWRDGRWTRLDALKSRQGRLTIDADLFTCTALLCAGAPSPLRPALTTLATNPWTIRGY